MRTLQDITGDLMQDPDFAREYDALGPEMDSMRAEMDAAGTATLQAYLAKQLQDPAFAREWEAIQPELARIRAEVDAQTEQF